MASATVPTSSVSSSDTPRGGWWLHGASFRWIAKLSLANSLLLLSVILYRVISSIIVVCVSEDIFVSLFIVPLV